MNQTPEQLARDKIDAMLEASGWSARPKKDLKLAAGVGVAVREYQTDLGPREYLLYDHAVKENSFKIGDKIRILNSATHTNPKSMHLYKMNALQTEKIS